MHKGENMPPNIYEGINNIYNFPKKLPYITVSAKGISNGLSSIINDGADFGPDSYLNTSSKNKIGPPYSLTSGIQEALNYSTSQAFYFNDIAVGYELIPIKLLTGIFNLNADLILPTFSNVNNSIPSFTITGEGSGVETPTQININNYYIYFGNGGIQTSNGGFLLQGLQFNGNYTGSINFIGNYNNNANCIFRDISINNINFYMNNAYNFKELILDNVYSNGQFIAPANTEQITITNGTFKNGLFLYNDSQIGGVSYHGQINMYEGDTNFSSNIWQLDYIGIFNGTALGATSNLSINTDMLIINSNYNFFNSMKNNGQNNGILNLKLYAKRLILNNIMNFSNSTIAGINILEFNIDEIINNTSYSIYSFNLPILSNTTGTTSGNIYARFIKYAPSYKKLILTFSDYVNNTTTNQTVNFPLPFNSYAIITANNTELNMSNTTTSITITSPNNTTAYNGIVIIEGY